MQVLRLIFPFLVYFVMKEKVSTFCNDTKMECLRSNRRYKNAGEGGGIFLKAPFFAKCAIISMKASHLYTTTTNFSLLQCQERNSLSYQLWCCTLFIYCGGVCVCHMQCMQPVYHHYTEQKKSVTPIFNFLVLVYNTTQTTLKNLFRRLMPCAIWQKNPVVLKKRRYNHRSIAHFLRRYYQETFFKAW